MKESRQERRNEGDCADAERHYEAFWAVTGGNVQEIEGMKEIDMT
jgi:hypothetical protein